MVWWGTEHAGDFDFSNDPHRLIAGTAFLVACFSAAAFVVETTLGACLPTPNGSVRIYIR